MGADTDGRAGVEIDGVLFDTRAAVDSTVERMSRGRRETRGRGPDARRSIAFVFAHRHRQSVDTMQSVVHTGHGGYAHQ